jgi:hypothetical protein
LIPTSKLPSSIIASGLYNGLSISTEPSLLPTGIVIFTVPPLPSSTDITNGSSVGASVTVAVITTFGSFSVTVVFVPSVVASNLISGKFVSPAGSLISYGPLSIKSSFKFS